jgi:hypothetical protein
MKDAKREMTELYIEDLGEVSGGGSGTPSPIRVPIATTRALGEEGGFPFTTLAVGEEGGFPGPIFTTNALGEEGGSPLPPAVD